MSEQRLTGDHIDSCILDSDFVVMGTTVICQLTLQNSFKVEGTASPLISERFDEKLCRRVAFENARKKIWELEGYLFKQRAYDRSLES